jgi:hypothetical protein
MIYTPNPILFGDKIEKNEISGECGTYGGTKVPKSQLVNTTFVATI